MRLKILTLILSASLNTMHFVRTFLVMRALGVRLIATEEVGSYKKIIFIKNIFENGWWEDAYSSFYPLDSPWPEATKTIKRIKHISVAWHHYYCSLLLKGRVKRGMGRGAWHNGPVPKYAPEGRI